MLSNQQNMLSNQQNMLTLAEEQRNEIDEIQKREINKRDLELASLRANVDAASIEGQDDKSLDNLASLQADIAGNDPSANTPFPHPPPTLR